MTVSAQLNAVFQGRWNEPALVADDVSFSYRELYARAVSIRDWLLTRGCREGDSVALSLPNGWPFAAAYLACIIGRYRLIPVNLELSAKERGYILERIAARVVVDDESVLAELSPADVNAPDFDYPVGEVAAVFFTSGTTGFPKGVCHTLDALVGNAIAFNQSQGLDEQTRLYHVLPMAYMAGFLNTLLSPWLAGGTVLLGPRFTPQEALQFWHRPLAWQANTIWFTPTLAAMLIKLSRDPEIAAKVGSSLRHVFCGTAPLAATVRQDFLDTFGCALQESYGMSEVLLVAAQTREGALRCSNVGCLLPDVQASFREVPERSDLELVIHTPYALTGYLLERGEASPLLMDGGMPTGDAASLDGSSLSITGRLKDIVIRGGLNVSTAAVEDALLQQAGVQDAAVVGRPHEFWGEIIVACLVAEPGVDIDVLQASLQQRCLSELGEGKRPDRYVWLEDFPRSTTGKVQKHRLSEMLEETGLK